MSEGRNPDGMIDAEPEGGMRTAEAQRQVEEHGGPREVPVEQRRQQQPQDGHGQAATPEEVQSSAPGQGADPDLSTGGES